MKKTVIVFIIIILIFVGLYLIGNLYALRFIRDNLHKKLGPGFTIENLELEVTQLIAVNATYVDSATNLKLFHIAEMRIHPSFSSLLKKKIGISRIEAKKPDIYIYRTPQGKIIGPWAPMVKKTPTKKAPPSKLVIAINTIQINDGTLNFSDEKITRQPAQIDLIHVDTHINNLRFPTISSKSPIDFNGILRNGGMVSLNGWFDLKSKNTDISIKVNEANITTFNSYIAGKAPITVESGTVNLTSRATVKNEKLDMPGTLEIINLQTTGLNNKKLKVEFHIKGDLSKPGFNFAEAFIGGIGKSIKDTLGTHLKEKGKGAAEKAKESIKKLFKKKR